MAQLKPLPCLPAALPMKLTKGKQGKGGVGRADSEIAANTSEINQDERNDYV